MNLGNNRQSRSTTLAVQWCLLRLLLLQSYCAYAPQIPDCDQPLWLTDYSLKRPKPPTRRWANSDQPRQLKMAIEYWILRVMDRDKRKENRECDQACYWYWDSGRRPEMQKAMESLRLRRMRINRLVIPDPSRVRSTLWWRWIVARCSLLVARTTTIKD